MHLCHHSDLLNPYQYLFPYAKPPWQPIDHFCLSHQKFGMHCQVIFRPFQLFLLLKKVSNTIFSCVLILTVGHLVASRHLNVSRFVIQHHLLPSHHWNISCRLAKLLTPVSSNQYSGRLRSAARGDLTVPRTRSVRMGPRSFAVSGPELWNSLAPELRNPSISLVTFKCLLKTELFKRAYPIV